MDHLMLLKQGVRAPSSLFLLLLRLKYKRDHDERRYPKKPQLYHSYLLDRQNCQNKLSLWQLIGYLLKAVSDCDDGVVNTKPQPT